MPSSYKCKKNVNPLQSFTLHLTNEKLLPFKFGNNSNSECHKLLIYYLCKDETKHIGNIISCDVSDAKDCTHKISQFIGSVNKLLGNYKHVPNAVLCRLFNI